MQLAADLTRRRSTSHLGRSFLYLQICFYLLPNQLLYSWLREEAGFNSDLRPNPGENRYKPESDMAARPGEDIAATL
jgi:hypothetical protein